MDIQGLNIELLAAALARHKVDYVLIGGMAVILHGGRNITADMDLAFDGSDENIERLADALQELSAKPKRWLVKEYRLRRSDLTASWLHLLSKAGDVDLIFKTPGVSYEDLKKEAMQFPVGTVNVVVASPRQLIAIKRVANRSRDIQHVEELEALMREGRQRDNPAPVA